MGNTRHVGARPFILSHNARSGFSVQARENLKGWRGRKRQGFRQNSLASQFVCACKNGYMILYLFLLGRHRYVNYETWGLFKRADIFFAIIVPLTAERQFLGEKKASPTWQRSFFLNTLFLLFNLFVWLEWVLVSSFKHWMCTPPPDAAAVKPANLAESKTNNPNSCFEFSANWKQSSKDRGRNIWSTRQETLKGWQTSTEMKRWR